MKYPIALFISVSAFIARAETVACTNLKSDVFEETVTLKVIDAFSYAISHYGSSRNTYSAHYQVTGSAGTRYGSSATLAKVSDESTWKDMPLHLVLKQYATGGANQLVLEGLLDQAAPFVYFDLNNCKHD